MKTLLLGIALFILGCGIAFSQQPFFFPLPVGSGVAAQIGDIALDASGAVGFFSGNTATTWTSNPYTATSSNDVIIAHVGCSNGSAAPTVTGVTNATGALTWAQRSHKTSPDGQNMYDVWYAKASGGFSSTVTATFSSACGTPAISIFGVVNVATTPWDTNVSLPALANGNTSTPTVSGVSTSKATTLILSMAGAKGSFSTFGPSPGWTQVQTSFNNGGCCFAAFGDYAKKVTSIQSSITVSYAGGLSANQWVLAVDALASR